MKQPIEPSAQALEELDALRLEVARLRALSVEYRATEARLTRLADFPEQNPDILVATDVDGRVTYLNRVAEARFPDIWREGFGHPLLHGLPGIVRAMLDDQQSYSADEISLGEATFERQICHARESDSVRIRIYVHDITRRKRAEKAIQNLAKQVVFAQEEERRRLSRELHDEAGQALTALKLSLELLRADLPAGSEELSLNLGEAVALAETTMERVRGLAHGLRPPALDTLGLNLTLEACCRDYARRAQLAIQYRGDDVKGLSDAMNICLYRVLQEALTNVVKHARARHVEVGLSSETGSVCLTVADDGCGIDPDTLSMLDRPAGIGLLGMRERLELLDGRLALESATGQGLRLTATLPLASNP
jgi:signal transduction histidine kinase